MDRLAAHVIATAALTVTLATVPVLFADASHAAATSVPASLTATTSPAQAPDARDDGSTPLPPLAAETQAQASAPAQAPAAGTAPGAAAAEPPQEWTRPTDRRCDDLRQVGATAHALYRGMVAFSVKEYYSAACHSYYGYSFAWLQFRRLHVRYDVGTAVYNATHDAIDGARTYISGAGTPDFWSAAVPAGKGECVQAEGHYFYYPAGVPGGFEEGDTFSPKVCA